MRKQLFALKIWNNHNVNKSNRANANYRPSNNNIIIPRDIEIFESHKTVRPIVKTHALAKQTLLKCKSDKQKKSSQGQNTYGTNKTKRLSRKTETQCARKTKNKG